MTLGIFTLLCELLFIIVTFKLIQFFKCQYQLYQQLKYLPGPEIRLSFLGNINIFWDILNDKERIGSRIKDRFSNLCDEYGHEPGYVRLWLGPFIPVLIICNYKLAREILNQHLDKSNHYNMLIFAVGIEAPITCKKADVRLTRRQFQNHFTVSALDAYLLNTSQSLEEMNGHLNQVMESPERAACVHFTPLVSEFILKSAGKNLYSISYVMKEGASSWLMSLEKLLTFLDVTLVQPWRTFVPLNGLLFCFINLSLLWPRELASFLKNYLIFTFGSARVVYQVYRNLQDNGTSIDKLKFSLLQAAVWNKIIQRKGLLGKLTGAWRVFGDYNNFVIASHGTSTSTVTFLVYMLTQNAAVEAKLRQEIDSFLADHPLEKSIDLADLKKLKYLEACISETLRLYTPTPIIGRTLETPIQLDDGTLLPASINTLIFLQYIHTREDNFQQAKRFYPERFLNSITDTESHSSAPWANPLAFLPFSIGQRVCPGKEYSRAVIKLFMVNFLSKYNFKLAHREGDSFDATFGLIQGSPDYHLMLQHRQKETIAN